jgi:uncharacterized protein (TIGR00266 family)
MYGSTPSAIPVESTRNPTWSHMQFSIEGELAQSVHLTMEPGEFCWTSKGALVAINPETRWTLKMPGGLAGTARRILSGEGLSLNYIEGSRHDEKVILSANQPGKIIAWDLATSGGVLTTRGAFVAAFGPRIDIDVTVARRAGAAFFGGAGLFLQKVSGEGTVLIHGAGDFVDRNLERGESLLVSTGNIAAFSDQVDYNIQTTGDARRILFSGEGLFVTRMTGPGKVLLQSLKRGSSK